MLPCFELHLNTLFLHFHYPLIISDHALLPSEYFLWHLFPLFPFQFSRRDQFIFLKISWYHTWYCRVIHHKLCFCLRTNHTCRPQSSSIHSMIPPNLLSPKKHVSSSTISLSYHPVFSFNLDFLVTERNLRL